MGVIGLIAVTLAQAATLRVGVLASGVETELAVPSVGAADQVWFYASLTGGAGPCPPGLSGACMGLVAPRLLGRGVVDGARVGRFAWTPAAVLEGGVLAVQAVVVAPDGSAVLTEVLSRPVFREDEVFEGDLTLHALADLVGVDHLRALTGDLVVAPEMPSPSWPALEVVGGTLQVWENPDLEGLEGLGGVRWVEGDLSLYDLDALLGLEGLASLERVGGSLSVQHVDGLGPLNAPPKLLAVGGDLTLHDNPNLEDLSGLRRLSRVGGDVVLWRNRALWTLGGLGGLAEVGGRFDLFDNDGLIELAPFAPAALRAVDLHHNDLLESIDGLMGLTALEGALEVRYSPALTHLDGLRSLVRVEGDVTLEANPGLASLAGLDGVEAVGGALVIDGLGISEVGLAGLGSVGGSLQVRNNPELVLLGLPALWSVGGVAAVGSNPSLPACEVSDLFARIEALDEVCFDALPDLCEATCAEP
jgi:hypothetical protein